jgi:methylmalonyl-CoA/ethylmalonyl-CoA epimerase
MRIHHVAYVTPNVDKKAAQLVALLGCKPAGPVMIDPAQGVRCQFMHTADGGLLELLEPHGEKSPIEGYLKKGGGIFHVCYEVEDLDATLQHVRDTGDAVVVRDPIPAPAIGNRRIAFIMTADRDLIEFVEVARR